MLALHRLLPSLVTLRTSVVTHKKASVQFCQRRLSHMASTLHHNHSRSDNILKTTAYVTDCEGNYDYWLNYISRSSVLYFDNDANIEQKNRQIFLRHNCSLVYGGDVCDRGFGDIRLLKDLLSLKKKYPERVHFVLGNRDINKLRLKFELHESSSLQCYPKVYWIREDPLSKPDCLGVNKNIVDAAERMKWILANTMGAPFSFEYRRQELEEIVCDQIDENRIARSFVDLIDPDLLDTQSKGEYGALLLEYLRLAVIACRIENVLFVHGAIHSYNLGWVPPDGRIQQEAKFVSDMSDWITEINTFARNEIEDYIRHSNDYLLHQERIFRENYSQQNQTHDGNIPILPCPSHWSAFGGYGHAQPGSRLLQYGMGWTADKKVNPSVIYASYMQNGKPNPPSTDVLDSLQSVGISHVVVGHQPVGDAPVVINCDNKVKIICGDTSYSSNCLWPVPPTAIAKSLGEEALWKTVPTENDLASDPMADTRGVTVSELIFSSAHKNGNIRGLLSNKCEYDFSLSHHPYNEYIGMDIGEDWMIKACGIKVHSDSTSSHTEPESCFLISKGEGYTCKNKLVDANVILSLLRKQGIRT